MLQQCSGFGQVRKDGQRRGKVTGLELTRVATAIHTVAQAGHSHTAKYNDS